MKLLEKVVCELCGIPKAHHADIYGLTCLGPSPQLNS